MIARTDTQHYQDIADELREANDYAAFENELDNAQEQIESDNAKFDDIDQQLQEINSKLEGVNLNNVGIGVMDFVNDDITIISGGLESVARRITT